MNSNAGKKIPTAFFIYHHWPISASVLQIVDFTSVTKTYMNRLSSWGSDSLFAWFRVWTMEKRKSKPIYNLEKKINPSIDGEGYFNDEKSTLVNELHAPYRQKYEKRAYIYRNLGEIQFDIADFQNISQYNYGVRIIRKFYDKK